MKLKFRRSIFLVLQFFAISIIKIEFTLFSSSSLSQHIIQSISKSLFKFSVSILQSKFLLLWCFSVQIEKLFLVMEDWVDSLLSFYSSFVVGICFLFRLLVGFFDEIDEAIYFWLFYHCFIIFMMGLLGCHGANNKYKNGDSWGLKKKRIFL